jgi:hypothetical protein
MITVGSKWISYSGSSKLLVVTGVEHHGEHVWVRYCDLDKTYTCLLEAFLSRFTPNINMY